MSALVLGFTRVAVNGLAKNKLTVPVKLVNVAQVSRYSRVLSSCYYSDNYGIRAGLWHHCRRDRYLSIQHRRPATCYQFNDTTLRSISHCGVLQQQRNAPNEQESASASPDVTEKLGLFARFKKMYKEYWYVLLPVHCITSVMWFGGFYYASTSGVDVIGILEWLGVSETLINPVRDSSLGHIAIAYLLYKIATPARYTVTLGGTTVSIKYLEQWGYIKPVPSKAQLVQMYKDKKENIQEKIAETKQDFQDRKQQLTEKKNNLMSDLKTKKDAKSTSNVTEDK
ncbi:uncharacterized protein C18orf19 homolog A [Anopheles bellator]|uniref:uncharacterized protein C18orf19 homolog A n=1 Tax=Anopheles bellator TaxID=139047 RepID=UPI0026472D46|nr:uncharacterized protein C18orf19 homolog A [Anopheles bellator]